MALDPETSITMADGQFIPAGDIENGDEVLAFDAAAKKPAPAKVISTEAMPHEKVVRVRIGDEITCSESQLFVMADFSSKKAVDLRPGDMVLNEDAVPTPVKSVREAIKPVELIEIKTEKGSLSAEGVYVGE